MTTFRKPLKPVPKPCPLCDHKRFTTDAILAHNIQASQTGCRVYQGASRA